MACVRLLIHLLLVLPLYNDTDDIRAKIESKGTIFPLAQLVRSQASQPAPHVCCAPGLQPVPLLLPAQPGLHDEGHCSLHVLSQ